MTLAHNLKALVAETRRGVDAEACTFLGRLSGSGKLAQAAQAMLAFNQAEDDAVVRVPESAGGGGEYRPQARTALPPRC